MTVTLPLPFRASRVLAPGNPWLGVPGVALELSGIELAPPIRDGWRRRVARAARHLGWPPPKTAVATTDGCRLLAFAAPANLLHTAREANEWALCACVVWRDPCHWGAVCEALRLASTANAGASSIGSGMAPQIDEWAALLRLQQLARIEAEACLAS